MPAQDFSRVLQFVSPLADILLVERRHKNQAFTYGEKHAAEEYKDHVLIAVTPDEDSDYQRWYYAAPRELQDQYNAEITYPYAGLPAFLRVTRTYLEPRETYAPLDKGSKDPLDVAENPANKFTGAKLVQEVQRRIGDQTFDNQFVTVQRVYDKLPTVPAQETYNWEVTYPYQDSAAFPRFTRKYVVLRAEFASFERGGADPAFASAVMISERVDRFNDELSDSLYLLITRVFDKIPELGNVEDLANLIKFGYAIDRPHGSSSYLRLTWRFPVKLADYSPATNLVACPITGYTALKLIDEDMQPDPNSAIGVLITRVYDSLAGPVIAEQAKIRNADVPDKFVSLRTTTQRKNRLTGATIDTPSGLPTTAGGAILQTQKLPDGPSVIVDVKADVRQEVTVSAIGGYEFDPDSGITLPYSQELVAAGTVPNGLDGTSQYEEISPLSPIWSVKTTRKSTGLASLGSRSWDQIINYTWPAVLVELIFDAVTARNPATSETYTSKYRYRAIVRDAYSGPCNALITESWSVSPAFLSTPNQMQPRAMEWDMILSQGAIQPTLHPGITLVETTGTTHPTYPYIVNSVEFPATNFVDWPASILADVSQIPYRGGFKITSTLVYRP